MLRSVGTDCRIYVDGLPWLRVGDALVTGGGSGYLVTEIRIQKRGANVGRKHLRCIRVQPGDLAADVRVFVLHWYRRQRAARA